MRYPLIALVRLWRALVSPSYGPVCKYHPTCSAYALRALETRGAIVGTALVCWRLLRCNPWSHGGYDPVPGTPEHAAHQGDQATGAPKDLPDLATSGASHDTKGEI